MESPNILDMRNSMDCFNGNTRGIACITKKDGLRESTIQSAISEIRKNFKSSVEWITKTVKDNESKVDASKPKKVTLYYDENTSMMDRGVTGSARTVEVLVSGEQIVSATFEKSLNSKLSNEEIVTDGLTKNQIKVMEILAQYNELKNKKTDIEFIPYLKEGSQVIGQLDPNREF